MSEMLERIEDHLARVQKIEAMQLTDVGVDIDHHKRTLLAAFERAEASGTWDPEELARALHYWLTGNLDQLVEALHWRLLAEFGERLEAKVRRELIDWTVVSATITVHEFFQRAEPSRTMQAWIDHACEAIDVYQPHLRGGPELFPWEVVSRYCERLGLVSHAPEGARLLMPGHTWLRLRGIDRLRWLLALEGARATDDSDEWCASAAQPERILRHADKSIPPVSAERREKLGLPEPSAVHRWTALGALSLSQEENHIYRYDLTPIGRQLFDRAQADVQDLFHNLARAQSRDDRNQAFRPVDAAATDSELAATTMRHARLVAHEVRNALLPVRHALNKIWRSLDDRQLGGDLGQPREQIERGIARLYEFVEASARMSAAIDDLPATFVVLEAVEEARRTLAEQFGGIKITTLPGTANPRCRGHRGRFVLALLNLMRNAIQVAGAGVELTITVDATKPDLVELTIEDDGPGVPDAIQEHLFENGTSSRNGGTGHGLALVREVVERELGGRISHEPGSSGGARFRLGLPSLSEPQR